MVAAREVELAVVEPPRHVDVHAARAVVVVRRQAFEDRDVALHAGAGGVGEVAADGAAGVGEAVGMPRRLRVEEQPRRLAGAGGEDDDLRAHLLLAAGRGVDVRHAGGAALVVREHLAGHGAGDDLEAAGGQGGRQQDGRAREVRARRASASALPAVVAGRPAVVGPGQDREARGDAGDLELVAGLLHQPLVGARRRAAAGRCRPARSPGPRSCRRARPARRACRNTASCRRSRSASRRRGRRGCAPLKSCGPKRSEMRPQWFVRPPSMRARHQRNRWPSAVV